jgi:NAD(P)-dependent dehydrogenase (short-subunit alcohol dehydrogenase family)
LGTSPCASISAPCSGSGGEAGELAISKSKVVLITGVTSGIGAAAAGQLIGRGHQVFGTTRKPGQATVVRGVEMLNLDLSDDAAAAACVEAVVRRAGRIDVLVNNAGYALFGAVEETSPDEGASSACLACRNDAGPAVIVMSIEE